MRVSGSLDGFKNSIINVDIYIDNPYSGFDFTVSETGAGVKYDLFSFSGAQGHIVDHSGQMFGGYRSGQYINITTHYDYDNQRYKYYFNNTLIANNMVPVNTSKIANCIEFEKYDNSTLQVHVTGQSA